MAPTIPETVYMFQMTFAIITPALIAGAFAERMKFSAMLWFMACGRSSSTRRSRTGSGGPTAYSQTPTAKTRANSLVKVLDFAGGTVVHINAGVAGLMCA